MSVVGCGVAAPHAHRQGKQMIELHDEQSPSGSNTFGYTTHIEPADSPLREGITTYLRFKLSHDDSIPDWEVNTTVFRGTKDKPLELHTHSCWVGHSEYTIEYQWAEITFTWGEFSEHFESMAEFFRALCEAVEWSDRESNGI